MKQMILILVIIILFNSCSERINKDIIMDEIIKTEKAFEEMCAEKGIAEAFYFYADENAVVKKDEELIKGKENILKYYSTKDLSNVVLKWTPDFVEISDDGTLAYTYGKYSWQTKDNEGKEVEYTGIFHTVWKKQIDGSWKYVWD